jgi:2'-5' RNA ligase
MRLFIAIELPEQLKKRLGGLRTDISGARWVPLVQLHLTLVFLGEVDADLCKSLLAALGAIKAPGFRLRFNRPGCFPHHRQPRVLWIGLDPEPLLLKLVRQLQQTVLDCGIPLEEKPFTPHITLARCKIPAEHAVNLFLEQHARLNLEPFDVQEFFLFQSQLTVRGAVHTALGSYSLREYGGQR